MTVIEKEKALAALGERPMVWNERDDYTLGARNEYDRIMLALETVPPTDIKKKLREAYAAGYTDAVQVMRERARAAEALKLDACTSQPEIIRCKDCKNSKHWYRDRRRCFLWSEDGVSVFDDGFCNYAERRKE